ncbi:MAG: ABC transporter ATP-binding protein [Clostridium sp.]|nr:ABC transporter ATP-binding protein [Clostridium sp.]
MTHTETIRTRNLSTGYCSKGHTTVVAKHINASLRSGELTCLLGANGAGKSTLLRTLSAFQPPLEGEVTVMGHPLAEYTDRRLATTVGVVLTERWDVSNLTVEDVVAMGRSPYTGFWGKLNAEDRARVEEAIGWVRIEHLTKRTVQTLSDGEQQKVMIAKALAQETPVIFLDEPTAFLDYPSKAEVMQLLHRLTRMMDKTVFLSTHDLEMALQTADRLWLMDKQTGVVTGTPEDLSMNGSIERLFCREGISFDSGEGIFRILYPTTAELKLTGEGTRLRMAARTLARNGIHGHADSSSHIHIHADDNGIRVNGISTNSLSEMQEMVEHLIHTEQTERCPQYSTTY